MLPVFAGTGHAGSEGLGAHGPERTGRGRGATDTRLHSKVSPCLPRLASVMPGGWAPASHCHQPWGGGCQAHVLGGYT